MRVSPPFSTVGPRLVTDPRLQPTPDYGNLGPGSDIRGLDRTRSPRPPLKSGLRFAHLVAVVVGTVGALIAGTLSKTHPVWPRTAPARGSEPKQVRDSGQLDRMKPQKQAEILLEQAVAHSDGAVEQISSRVGRWSGKLEWNPQIAALTTAALNSNDLQVRESGVEVELAAYGLSKNSASAEYLLNAAESPDHRQKIWALWALGLMANRGVDAVRITARLASHLKDSDEDSRRWAVEGLAVAGRDESIPALLAAVHDDPSPVVRERAACSLAESGMFTPEQRQTTIPTLLNYTDDPSLDTQTQGWAFEALGDITHQRLPRDSAAWRSWYQQSVASGQ